MFTSKINTLTGRTEWEIQSEDYDYQQELARAGFADMLHDYERNKKYYDGLKKVINKLKSENKTVNVLDIGTGTGLLSMMAVRCGADKVTACEAFKPMVQVAKNCIASNGMADKITIIEKRSTEIQMGVDMTERANVLVTEVFDTELIGEGAISTFKHALENLLTKDCYVIPDNAVMYIQVVDSKVCQNWNWLNLDNGFKIKAPSNYANLAGDSILDVQLTQFNDFKPLTQPLEAFKFSFSGKEPQLVFDNVLDVNAKAIDNGSSHAIFMWWVLRMDYENEILLSCAPKWAHHDPNNMQWRDHWMQAIYFPRQILQLKKDEKFIVNCNHDEYSLWFDVDTQLTKKNQTQLGERSLGVTIVSRNRLGQINDIERNNMFVNVLEKHQGEENSVLIANDDFSIVPFLAAKMNFKQVYVLETNQIRKRCLDSFIIENNLANKVQIVEKAFHELDEADYQHKKFNILFSELSFSQALLPWENLYFYYGSKNAKKISADTSVKFLPNKITFKAIAVNFENLDKIRSPVENCEGFSIAEFDKVILGASKDSDGFQEPHPLWEYPCKAISLEHEIFSFDCNKTDKNISQVIDMPIVYDGLLNGVALWQTVQYDDENELNCGLIGEIKENENLKWSINYKQAVHLFDKKHLITMDNKSKINLKCIVNFDIEHGKFSVDFKINEL